MSFTECHNAEFHNAECRYAKCHCAECHCAECRYAECRSAFSDAMTKAMRNIVTVKEEVLYLVQWPLL